MFLPSRLTRRSVAGVLAMGAVLAAGSAPPASASSQIEPAFAKNQLASLPAAPEDLYPNGLRFDVVRKGDVVGEHRTTFRRDGDTLVVDSRMSLDIGFLGMTLYTYDYTATGRWRDGVPVSVDARVNEDGDVRRLEARWTGDTLTVDGSKGAWTAESPVMPTNHWNAAVLTRSEVLNTITGGRNSVTITPGPVERVETGTGPREARRFDYTGELEVQVWYDARGRWVKLAFEGKDGTPVTYVCTECGGDPNG